MVDQHTERLLNEALYPMDITATQFKVLCSIHHQGSLSPVELKKILSVDLGALTRMLDRLVGKEWVYRLPNPKDKRGVLVSLTPAGMAMCQRCHCTVGLGMHNELTKNMTVEEVDTLYMLLTKILPKKCKEVE